MKKDVYRKAALERLATVDQLDKVMKITSPLCRKSYDLTTVLAFTSTMAAYSLTDGIRPFSGYLPVTISLQMRSTICKYIGLLSLKSIALSFKCEAFVSEIRY